jgi:hypothetical protein
MAAGYTRLQLWRGDDMAVEVKLDEHQRDHPPLVIGETDRIVDQRRSRMRSSICADRPATAPALSGVNSPMPAMDLASKSKTNPADSLARSSNILL